MSWQCRVCISTHCFVFQISLQCNKLLVLHVLAVLCVNLYTLLSLPNIPTMNSSHFVYEVIRLVIHQCWYILCSKIDDKFEIAFLISSHCIIFGKSFRILLSYLLISYFKYGNSQWHPILHYEPLFWRASCWAPSYTSWLSICHTWGIVPVLQSLHYIPVSILTCMWPLPWHVFYLRAIIHIMANHLSRMGHRSDTPITTLYPHIVSIQTYMQMASPLACVLLRAIIHIMANQLSHMGHCSDTPITTLYPCIYPYSHAGGLSLGMCLVECHHTNHGWTSVTHATSFRYSHPYIITPYLSILTCMWPLPWHVFYWAPSYTSWRSIYHTWDTILTLQSLTSIPISNSHTYMQVASPLACVLLSAIIHIMAEHLSHMGHRSDTPITTLYPHIIPIHTYMHVASPLACVLLSAIIHIMAEHLSHMASGHCSDTREYRDFSMAFTLSCWHLSHPEICFLTQLLRSGNILKWHYLFDEFHKTGKVNSFS